MEDDFSLDNILDSSEIDELFNDSEQDNQDITEEVSSEEDTKEENNNTTEKVDGETLFDSESVGSGENDDGNSSSQEGGKGETSSGSNVSPTHFYSSIAQAFRDDDIFPDLSDEDIKNIKSAEDFADAIEKQMQYRLDATQRRINDALNANLDSSDIAKYENTIKQLNNITDDVIEDESDKGENLRKSLIYQDYINKDYSPERAKREVQKSFSTGSDIEDAKEALDNLKSSVEKEYNTLIKNAQAEKAEHKKALKEQAETLKKSILEDKVVMGDITLDNNTKRKVYENISKPIYKDPESGELLTAIQKYEKENHVEFMKNLGILFTLTNGFKNFEGILKGSVNRAVKKSIKELENTINNTSRAADGSLKFVSNINDGFESFSIDI